MHHAAIWAIAAILTGMVPAEALADQASTRGGAPSSPPTATSDWKQARANPYSRLFQVSSTAEAAARIFRTAPLNQAPIVKCGMTLIPGDPRIDPGIATPQIKEPTTFTMRGVEPPICR
jgi:hypothetical protein